MSFENLRLSTRLALAFGLVVLLGVVGNLIALSKLAQLNANLDDVVNDNNVKLQMTQTMSEQVHIVARVLRTIVLLDDEQQKTAERLKIDAARAQYAKAHETLTSMPSSDAGKAQRAAIDAAAEKARPLNTQVIELGLAKKDKEAVELLMKEAAPATTQWQTALDANIEFQTEANAKQYATAQADYASARTLVIGIALMTLAVAATVATLIVRSVVRALGGEPAHVVELVRAVADGDLSRNIPVKAGDTTSVMAAVSAMQSSLTQVVASVRQNSESVATASAQIAQGNQDLSQRTEEQASALQQTAATMEELGGTVRNNADNARQANQLAQGASAVAAQGGEVVGQVVTTMQGISDSSRRIGDIIGVIDGIAFQTNILALNAAVEAARAGEQGRGFAVVAGEVRTLAQRSAEAAKEIKALIGRSVEQVEQGTVLVDQAGKTMGEIVGSIRRVSDIVAEISAASTEQSGGIQQVGDAVTQMDQVTQQNAALVEESAAAAESLKGQAGQLVQVVSVFKLSAAAHAAMPNTPAAHAATVAPTQSTALKRTAPAKPASRSAGGSPTAKTSPSAEPAAAKVAVASGGDNWESF